MSEEINSEIGKRPRPKPQPDTWGWDDAQCDPVIENITPVIGGQRIYMTLYAPTDKFYDLECRVELEPGEVDDRDSVTRLGDITRAVLSQLNCPGATGIEDNKIIGVPGGSRLDFVRELPPGWNGKRAIFQLIATES